jgi:hypothetical protein
MAYSKRRSSKRHSLRRRSLKRNTHRRRHTRRSRRQRGRGLGSSKPYNYDEDYGDMDHPIWKSTDLKDIPKLGEVIGAEHGGEERAKDIIQENIIDKVARSHPDFQATIREEKARGTIPTIPVDMPRDERPDLRKQIRERYNALLLSWFKTQKQLGNIGTEYDETIRYIENERI